MSEPLRRSRVNRGLRTVARHGRLKRHNPFTAIAKALAATLAVLLVSGGAVAAYAVWNVASSIRPVTLANETPGAEIPSIDAIEGGVNLLLVWSDSRHGQDPVFGDAEVDSAVLNDVTMLMHISEDHTNATVVSFPRDMFVPIPECPNPEGGTYSAMSSQKINTTLGYGGLACTVLTVENLTGLSIPFAAEVEFSGVIEMSNAVGGVDVCVAEPISDPYTDLYLDAGTHSLQGLDALQFLRTRHGVGDGSDLGRISNQQVFLSSLVRELQSAETLSDPAKLYGIAKAAANNMSLSTSLSNINTMVSIAMALKDIPLENIVFVQYPNGYGTSNGQSGVLPLQDAADQLFEAIQADLPIGLSGDTGVGSVLEPGQENTATPPSTPENTAPEATAPETTAPEATEQSTAPPATDPSTGNVVLPENVQGQTAGDHTCSAGNG